MNQQEFKNEILNQLNTKYHSDIKHVTLDDLYTCIVDVIRKSIEDPWVQSRDRMHLNRRVYLLSFEYLPEKFLSRNLSYLDLEESLKEILASSDFTLEDILEKDLENSLGNGTLGELSYNLLDAGTQSKIPMIAMGLRYQKSNIQQVTENNEQIESTFDWLENGHPWEFKTDKTYKVGYHDQTVDSEVYEIPIISNRGAYYNTLRLFTSTAKDGTDEDLNRATSITEFLYPSEVSIEGKIVRLKQEYFFASSVIQNIFDEEQRVFGDIQHIEDHIKIQILQVHPVLTMIEFIKEYRRITKKDLSSVLKIVKEIFSFTNETLLNEAMEQWNLNLLEKYLPDVSEILVQVDEWVRFNYQMKNGLKPEMCEYIIVNQYVNLVNMAYFLCGKVIVLSDFHKKVFMDDKMRTLYDTYPKNLKVIRNGINHRSSLILSNGPLMNYLVKLLGRDFLYDLKKLELLYAYRFDKDVLQRLANIKLYHKKRISEEIRKTNIISVNPYSLYDMHLKNFHEYRRQLMTGLYIFRLYIRLKDNVNLDFCPRTFFFAGKSPKNYLMAKQIIYFINSLAKMINKDRLIKEKIRIVFIENMNATKALKFIPAADIDENISTPGLDMNAIHPVKFMLNGAAILGSKTGINLDIRNEVGDENVFLFGSGYDEIIDQYEHHYYTPYDFIENNEEIKHLVNQLINCMDADVRKSFQCIYDLLLKYNDSFIVLKDLESYFEAQDFIAEKYRLSAIWDQIRCINISKSSRFSIDSMIESFKKKIWSSS